MRLQLRARTKGNRFVYFSFDEIERVNKKEGTFLVKGLTCILGTEELCTGIISKSGKPVYEGDLILYGGRYFPVIYQDGQFSLEVPNPDANPLPLSIYFLKERGEKPQIAGHREINKEKVFQSKYKKI